MNRRGDSFLGKKNFDPVLEKYLDKDILILEKSGSKICMRSLFFTNRRAFKINLTCYG